MVRGGAEARIIQDVLLEMLVKRACVLKLECRGCRGERGFGAYPQFLRKFLLLPKPNIPLPKKPNIPQ